jgi:hypothetical protein
MAKIYIKYMRLKVNHGNKCHTVGLAKNAVDGMLTCDISPPKIVQNRKFMGGRIIHPP